MTTAADDSAVEGAFEALLAGRPVPDGAAGLTAFTEAVRERATVPGRPNAALAELLATGLLVDQSSPSARTAISATVPLSCGPLVRIRRRSAMILTTLLAKIAAGGAVAQATAGAGIVLVAVAGAGTAGVLPGPVQDTFATVVATVSPTEGEESTEQDPTGEPTEETPTEESTGDVVGEDPVEEPVTGETPPGEAPTDEPTGVTAEEWLQGPTADGSFGAWVSAGAGNAELKAQLKADGTTFGKMVSCYAQARNDLRKGRDAAPCVSPAATPEEPVEPAPLEPAPVEPAPVEPAPVEPTEPTTGEGSGDPAPAQDPVVAEQTTQDAGGQSDGGGTGAGNGGGNGGGNGKGNGRD